MLLLVVDALFCCPPAINFTLQFFVCSAQRQKLRNFRNICPSIGAEKHEDPMLHVAFDPFFSLNSVAVRLLYFYTTCKLLRFAHQINGQVTHGIKFHFC